MIKRAYNYFSSIPAVFLDGVLYAAIALFTFLGTTFGGDEAAKWITPKWLFIDKTVIGSLSAISLSIKLYRSTAYSDHLKQKEKENNEVIPNQPPIVGQPTP